MKTAKVVINIFSVVVFVFIILQSCVAGLANSFSGNESDPSSTGGFLLAILMLTAGIVGLVTRNNTKSGIAVAILYGIGAIIGFSSLGTLTDLIFWSILCLAFCILYVIDHLQHNKKNKNTNTDEFVDLE